MAGFITTASQYKNALEESERDIFGNRTWYKAYGDISYSEKLTEQQLNTQFGEDVGKAYQAAMQSRSNILASNLGTGYQEALLTQNEEALNAAYDSYLSKLQSNKLELATNTQEYRNQVTDLLSTRSENFAALDNEYYNYLVALDKWQQENMSNPIEGQETTKYDEFMNSAIWGKFYTTDPDGTRRLLTKEELTTPRYDPATNEWVSLYNDKGQLTARGIDFYDQLSNYYAGRVAEGDEKLPPSFAQYLQSNNPDLYDFANEYNPFSYTPTGTGISQNIGIFKELHGINSDDEQYSFLERFGGLTKNEIDTVFQDLTSFVDKKDWTFDDINVSIDKLKKLTNEIGYKDIDWERIKQDVESVKISVDKAVSTSSTDKAVAGITIIAGILGYVATGLSLFIPGVNLVTGGAVPAMLTLSNSAITAGVISAQNAGDVDKWIADQKNQLSQSYRDMLMMMVNDIQRQKVEVDKDLNNRLGIINRTR